MTLHLNTKEAIDGSSLASFNIVVSHGMGRTKKRERDAGTAG